MFTNPFSVMGVKIFHVGLCNPIILLGFDIRKDGGEADTTHTMDWLREWMENPYIYVLWTLLRDGEGELTFNELFYFQVNYFLCFCDKNETIKGGEELVPWQTKCQSCQDVQSVGKPKKNWE